MMTAMSDMPAIWTIGHATLTFGRFLELLDLYGLNMVVDVRSQPYTTHADHFCKQPLEKALALHGKGYLFKGGVLGGRPDLKVMRTLGLPFDHNRQELHAALFKHPQFQQEIDNLVRMCQNGSHLALLCSEENPFHCHRRQLVGRALQQRGITLAHIRSNGSLQSDEELACHADQHSLLKLAKSPAGV